MIMKTTLSGLVALAIIAGAPGQVAAATADDGCDMNWTGGSWSRPVFAKGWRSLLPWRAHERA